MNPRGRIQGWKGHAEARDCDGLAARSWSKGAKVVVDGGVWNPRGLVERI
jgi:hypothetical protein